MMLLRKEQKISLIPADSSVLEVEIDVNVMFTIFGLINIGQLEFLFICCFYLAEDKSHLLCTYNKHEIN